jgi:superfamily II DNA helicase RecQ
MLSLVSEPTKFCPRCKEEKYFSVFGKDSTKTSGLSSYCKPCAISNRLKNYKNSIEKEKEKLKQYYKKNKEKSRSYSLKNLYGLTLEQFEEMKNAQEGSCKICKTHESNLKRRLFVDHCHETGYVRGLLCQSCNTMIGNAKDNILVLQSAINYLSSKS